MQEVSRQLTTEEELFCTRYELETLSGIVNHNRLERWLPSFCSAQTHNEHESRYSWVKDFVKGKTVLDMACGTGFGSYKLASEGGAAKVDASDIDERTIRYASLRNQHPALSFAVNDAETFVAANGFDIIISFETIEHLENPQTFLNNINGSLTDNGQCFISTPIATVTENKHPDNVFHRTEWGFKKFQELVESYLRITDIYLQVYNVQAMKPGFLSKMVQRSWLKPPDAEATGKIIPRKWDPRQIREELIGKEWAGYQILQCSKKANA